MLNLLTVSGKEHGNVTFYNAPPGIPQPIMAEGCRGYGLEKESFQAPAQHGERLYKFVLQKNILDIGEV